MVARIFGKWSPAFYRSIPFLGVEGRKDIRFYMIVIWVSRFSRNYFELGLLNTASELKKLCEHGNFVIS